MQNNGVGRAQQGSELEFLLNNMLAGLGDSLTKDAGTVAWCEAYVRARFFNNILEYGRLMSNQLDPVTASVYQDRWQRIMNVSMDPNQYQQYAKILQQQKNLPPTLNNVTSFLQQILGNVFLSIQWKQELQVAATSDPSTQKYYAPLWQILVYMWQPRDNQDHLLLSTPVFNNIVEGFKIYTQNWLPVGINLNVMNLTNRGNQDGYCNNYHPGVNDGSTNYADGYNVVSGTAGSTSLTGVVTTFTTDIHMVVNSARLPGINVNPPIQIVDDLNQVQTYYIKTVTDNTHLVLTTPLLNNITSRTYRILGIVADTPGMTDNASLASL
jgi:hypothetical protein